MLVEVHDLIINAGVFWYPALEIVPPEPQDTGPVDKKLPPTCSFAYMVVTPIPTLPVELIRILSTPPSLKANVSGKGLNIPVLVSLEKE